MTVKSPARQSLLCLFGIREQTSMDRHSICGAAYRHPVQQHALHDVRRDLLPGLHAVMDQRQRDIGQQLHLERGVDRAVHAAAMNAVPPPARASLT